MSKKLRKQKCRMCEKSLESCECISPPAILRKKRHEKGMTRNELANELGVWPSTISRMEDGSASIGELSARRIAPLFNMHWSELYWSVGKEVYCPKCGTCVKNLNKD